MSNGFQLAANKTSTSINSKN